ncbi:MAG TPA: hypothetical protein VL484_16170 [Vicinamibacterales bacterium]|jgi:hypothetical protein|nr:hypothetical protein [Vicinamibacterales bacterium]
MEAMSTRMVSLVHLQSDREHSCAVCRARFVPSEDSGSRVLSIETPGDEPFSALMCGGCHSKWSHGKTVTLHRTAM